MLVFSRQAGEKIVIDGIVTVEILGLKGNRTLIGITAPREIPIGREEVYLQQLRLTVEPICSVVQFDTAARKLAC